MERTLLSITRSHSFGSVASIAPFPITPAAFTSPSSPPNARSHSAAQRAHTASSRTSPVSTCASPPALAIAAAVSSSRARRRPAAATRAPSAPSASAHARPMPLEAPVTSTQRPAKRRRAGASGAFMVQASSPVRDSVPLRGQLALPLLTAQVAPPARIAELVHEQERDHMHHPPAELEELQAIREHHVRPPYRRRVLSDLSSDRVRRVSAGTPGPLPARPRGRSRRAAASGRPAPRRRA